MIFSITTTDYNGAFDDVYHDIEKLIDTDEVPRKEVNMDSCSVAKGEDNIATRISEWLGVKVNASDRPAPKSLVNRGGRVIAEWYDEGEVLPHKSIDRSGQ